MKINTKLNLAFGITLFLPLLLSAVFSLYYYSQKLRQETQETLAANLQATDSIIAHKLEEMRKLALAYASNPALGLLVKFPYLTSQINKQLEMIRQDVNVDVAAITSKPNTLYVQHALAAEIVSGLECQQNTLTMVAAAPIRDREGDFVGALEIQQVLDNARFQNLIVGKITTPMQIHCLSESSPAPLASSGFVSSRPLHNLQGNLIATLEIRPDSTSSAATKTRAVQIFALIGLGGGTLAFLLQYIIRRSIVRPILVLRDAADHIAQGQFAQGRVSLSGYDEIGKLGAHFDRMVVCLQEHFQQYQQLIERAVHGIGVLQEGKWVFVNTVLLNLVAKHEYELLEKPAEALFGREGIPAEWENRPGQWLSCQQMTILWKHQSANLLTVQDITAQKQRELQMENERRRLEAENLRLRETMQERDRFGDIIGKSLPMQKIYEQLPNVAASQATVLLLGETGTGKGLIARTIHKYSPRKKQPFVPVNCGGIAECLLEREFFGHVKGAFTGANRNTPGFLDAAKGGTLFLDEIGELPPSMQVKLLHVLDGDGFTPLGSSNRQYPSIRIIAATNQNLEMLLETKRLREDFFHRINMLPITAPPLRHRREDIPLLTQYFTDQYQEKHPQEQHPHETLCMQLPRFHEQFLHHSWPGNVRELKYMVERLLILKHIDADYPLQHVQQSLPAPSWPYPSLKESIEKYEKFIIETTLAQLGGHRERTAELLGIPTRSFYRKLKKFGL